MANRVTTIFDLDDKGIVSGLKNLRTDIASTDGLMNKLKVGAKGFGDVLRQNALPAAAAAAAVIVEFGRQSVQSFQEGALAAGQFADATGTTAEEASRLIEVADDIGVSADAMRGAIQRMSKAAADGTIDVAGFGNTVAKTAQGNTDVYQTFINTATAIGALGDASAREAAARQTFGKSWAEIAELTKMSADELKAALEGVSDAEVFDAEEVAQARAFRDAVDQLNGSFTGLKNTVGADLVANLTTLAEAANGVIAAFSKLPAGLQDSIMGAFNPLSNLTDIWGKFDTALHGTDLPGITAAVVAYGNASGGAAEDVEKLADAEAHRAANQIIVDQLNENDAASQRARATATAVMTQRLNEMAAALDGIPADKYVEIQAAIAEGDIQKANALLNAVAAERIARITILVSATMGAQMGSVGGAGAAAAAAAAGAGVASAYQAAVKAAMSSGGGGGGGGGSSVAEEEVVTWEEAMARAYAYGEITRDQYRQFHAERLAGLDKYTDAYDESMRIIMGLDKEAAAERAKADKEAADAAQKLADEQKRAADEQKKLAEENLAKSQKMVELLTDLLAVSYGNLNRPGNIAGSGAGRSELGGFLADLLREFEESLS